MRNVLSTVALFSICLVVGFGSTGCESKKAKKEPPKTSLGDRFFADKDAIAVQRKGATIKVRFSKDVKEVSPAEKDGVKAKVDGKVVEFKQTGASPSKDTQVEFRITGGKDDKEQARITVTVKKKKS